MNNKTVKYLESNWDQLKGQLKKQWSKLTDDDILLIEGSYDQLVGKIKELYGSKIKDVESEILEFLTKSGLNEKEAAHKDESEAIDSMKGMIFKYLDDYFENIKEKSMYIEEKTVNSVKENPFKWLGMAAVGGFILAKLVL